MGFVAEGLVVAQLVIQAGKQRLALGIALAQRFILGLGGALMIVGHHIVNLGNNQLVQVCQRALAAFRLAQAVGVGDDDAGVGGGQADERGQENHAAQNEGQRADQRLRRMLFHTLALLNRTSTCAG